MSSKPDKAEFLSCLQTMQEFALICRPYNAPLFCHQYIQDESADGIMRSQLLHSIHALPYLLKKDESLFNEYASNIFIHYVGNNKPGCFIMIQSVLSVFDSISDRFYFAKYPALDEALIMKFNSKTIDFSLFCTLIREYIQHAIFLSFAKELIIAGRELTLETDLRLSNFKRSIAIHTTNSLSSLLSIQKNNWLETLCCDFDVSDDSYIKYISVIATHINDLEREGVANIQDQEFLDRIATAEFLKS